MIANYIGAFVLGFFGVLCIIFMIVLVGMFAVSLHRKYPDGSYVDFNFNTGLVNGLLVSACMYLLYVIWTKINELLFATGGAC